MQTDESVSTSRRAVLARAAALPAAVAVPASGDAVQPLSTAEPDPHPAWTRQWIELTDASADPGLSEEAYQHLIDQILELEHLVGTTPARGLDGARAQIRLALLCLREGMTSGEQVEAGLESALGVLDRLAEGWGR
jgi:hypothetical protein